MANLKAVLQRPKVSATYSRNAFDRSFSVNTSYQLGGLDPFFAEPVLAGSHIKINRAIFQRTAAVSKPAFPTVNTHVEFFAVPLRLLFSPWNDMKLNIKDYNSSVFSGVSSETGQTVLWNVNSVPTMNLYSIWNDMVGALQDNESQIANPKYFYTRTQATEALRLLNGLGYGHVRGSQDYYYIVDLSSQFQVNALKLAAYQKIYFDHFRNTAYESNDVAAYNLDKWIEASGSMELPNYMVEKLLTYRYVNYRKDYFQSIYPALNYVMSAPSGLNWQIPDSVMYGLSVPSNSGGTAFYSPSVTTSNNSGGQVRLGFPMDASSIPRFNYGSVQQIRAAFALDKLLRASSYAPKHVKDQFEARYGVKGVESGNESIRIGAFMNDIVLQEVTGTAGSNLGELGGKGVGYQGMQKDIEFTAKEDCLVLGLIYSMPRTSYDSNRLSNWNAKVDREDFMIPEFMDLGMQPLYAYEYKFDYNFPYNGPNFDPRYNHNNDILGYTDRYKEYKCGIDTNLGQFNASGVLSDFVVHSMKGKLAFNSSDASNVSVDSNWFKVGVQDMDSCFVQATDPSKSSTDKFITHIDVKFIVNQNLSIHGQPRLGGLV